MSESTLDFSPEHALLAIRPNSVPSLLVAMPFAPSSKARSPVRSVGGHFSPSLLHCFQVLVHQIDCKGRPAPDTNIVVNAAVLADPNLLSASKPRDWYFP